MKNIPYSNAIGSVMYLMVSTRPDIAYAVSCLSRYMSNAGLPHWEALKWLLSWKSQLQNIVALSTTEAEYIATTEAFKEAIWLKGNILWAPVILAMMKALTPTPWIWSKGLYRANLSLLFTVTLIFGYSVYSILFDPALLLFTVVFPILYSRFSTGLQSAKAIIRFVNDESARDAAKRARPVYLQLVKDTKGGNVVGRADGWTEVEMGNFYVGKGDDGEVEARLLEFRRWKTGLIVKGVLFRPTFRYTGTPLVSKKSMLTKVWG
ncbi:UNVERIFIED_CONTAM: Retrovirus-related Pol polyprotein from transposon TNT 1-94 [Sesamum angustifolium]|uniref:Retrovirus-related Pol polyprotein from transposon TNT 1-94 n=1 Tax=Sesamum angustifolium TaxID=2727405 RepID=A0AAW2P1Q0_9LAMI